MISDVVIAGAGIGGLTLAIALQKRGVHVTVLERAADLQPVGAGLALPPNGVKVLTRLGLSAEVEAAGAVAERTAMLDSAGRHLGAVLEMAPIYRTVGAPLVAMHRARLHGLLRQAARASVIRSGVAVTGYAPGSRGVTVLCAGGERIETALLVGADGLHSAIRAQMVDDGAPTYAGYTSWRGVTPAGAVPRPTLISESWGRGERFGIADIGFRQVYWFACADAPAGGKDADVHQALLGRFGGWHEPVRQLIEATPAEAIVRTDISDRPPVARWHDGAVVLLGDAAHPMTPNLGQGAGQAIEDAAALDDCLAAAATLEEALVSYERRRVKRANGIARASRQLGAVAQWRHPAAVVARNTMMRLLPAAVGAAQARRLMQAEA